MQNGVYPARIDRQIIASVFRHQERVLNGAEVLASTPTPDMNVTITIGTLVVQGDDEPNQGMYLVVWDADITVAMPSPPGGDSRIDIVGMQVNDPQAGGSSGDNADYFVVQGTAAGSPTPPAIPDSAVGLAQILRSSGESSIQQSAITRIAPDGYWPYGLGTTPPPANVGVPGDLYLRYS